MNIVEEFIENGYKTTKFDDGTIICELYQEEDVKHKEILKDEKNNYISESEFQQAQILIQQAEILANQEEHGIILAELLLSNLGGVL